MIAKLASLQLLNVLWRKETVEKVTPLCARRAGAVCVCGGRMHVVTNVVDEATSGFLSSALSSL